MPINSTCCAAPAESGWYCSEIIVTAAAALTPRLRPVMTEVGTVAALAGKTGRVGSGNGSKGTGARAGRTGTAATGAVAASATGAPAD